MNILDVACKELTCIRRRSLAVLLQVWDLLQLWLAMLHGTNGLRTVINDYAEKNGTRFTLHTLLYVGSIFIIILGTYVIFTFDPNIGSR